MNELRISGRLLSVPKRQDHLCTVWLSFAKNRPLQISAVGELAEKLADEFREGYGIGVTGRLYIRLDSGIIGVNAERLNRIVGLDLGPKQVGVQELGWNKLNNPLDLPKEWLVEAGVKV